MTKILMVCLGNICRSPVAEGVMRMKAEQNGLDITVDSAGTAAWHEGNSPDRRSMKNAMENGVSLKGQKSRPVNLNDFEEFDILYAMDHSNYENLLAICPQEHKSKVKMILNETYPGEDMSVPDPYYSEDGFQEVFDLINEACDVIVSKYKNGK